MKNASVARAPLPLEKNSESIVSWLVIGLALLIFACHAGAAIWSSSLPASLEAQTSSHEVEADDGVLWSGGLWGGQAATSEPFHAAAGKALDAAKVPSPGTRRVRPSLPSETTSQQTSAPSSK